MVRNSSRTKEEWLKIIREEQFPNRPDVSDEDIITDSLMYYYLDLTR